ncbi:hypothetical protein CTAYLR_010192 [Chrysophaeum taylorii]|uniref:Cytochrome b5 heme-binding domain-containing protein n=1 Tax=Chrysophaeum taylorii TaxID=2483200 RepID=A0AAD7U807_9STRA|nr:hypothetical protein CTAYLR_010192 [Chrysophaeum taylorii]
MLWFCGEEWQFWSHVVMVLVSLSVAYWQSVPSTMRSYADAWCYKAKVVQVASPSVSSVQVPDDVVRCVFELLEARRIAAAAVVCPRWRSMADADAVWQSVWHRDFFEVDAALSRAIGRRSRAPPGTPWKLFYSQYAVTWLEHALVGANLEDSRVHVGIRGALYDVTTFASSHPGSADTLLDFAGSDATQTFEAVGHSTVASGLMSSMLIVSRPKTGSLALVKADIDHAKSRLSKLTLPCPRCPPDAIAPPHRPFYDATTARWHQWWPCCGFASRILVDVPKRTNSSSWSTTFVTSFWAS